MKLSQYTIDLLNDIENRIIPWVEDDFLAQWQAFWDNKVTDIVFRPKRKIISQPSIKIQDIHINDALNDYELMLDMQLADVSYALSTEQKGLCMRANYGTGIMSSLFGAKFFEMPREQNTLPTTLAFNDTDVIREMVEKGMPDVTTALGEKVFAFGEMCLEIFKDYPKISKYVFMYHPDTQGPIDTAELLWGGEMFYALYDDPDLVHATLDLITNTQITLLDRWFKLYPNKPDLNVHWGWFMRGGVCVRNDSSINLSSEQYSELVLPYDQKLLDYYNGGLVHYCGKGDHFIGIVAAQTKATAVNLSQPHLNDVDKVLNDVLSCGKKILFLSHKACQRAIELNVPASMIHAGF